MIEQGMRSIIRVKIFINGIWNNAYHVQMSNLEVNKLSLDQDIAKIF
jgi:hypothetical protein